MLSSAITGTSVQTPGANEGSKPIDSFTAGRVMGLRVSINKTKYLHANFCSVICIIYAQRVIHSMRKKIRYLSNNNK